MQSDVLREATARTRKGKYIFIACPWTPKGGGMFKIADYLIQAQSCTALSGSAELRPLDTRGGAHAIFSLWFLLTALGRLVLGRASGRLAGVHVNMAERLSLLRKSVVIVVSRALGLPVVLHLHAAQLHHFYRDLPRPLQALTRWVFSLPSTCVVLGTAARRFVIDELQVAAERVEIVINGVPEPAVQRRKAITDGVQKILFVGNLSERKGVSDLLHALVLVARDFDEDRLQVSIAGGGDIQLYQKKLQELGLERFVRLEGWANQSKVAHLMASADVLVLPSYDEGLPLVILEALANGVAVLCSPVGEIPSALTDGVDAIFVQPGNPEGLAAGLQKILADTTLRESLERNGRVLYEQRYSLVRFFSSVAMLHQRHFGVAGRPRQHSMNLQEKTR